jgi:hypothetical protein
MFNRPHLELDIVNTSLTSLRTNEAAIAALAQENNTCSSVLLGRGRGGGDKVVFFDFIELDAEATILSFK